MRPLTDEQSTQIMHYFPPRLGKFSIPSSGILDAPYYCLIINVEWIGHLIGVLDALDQADAWQGTTTEIDNARQEVRKLITAINPCEESNLVFRQNPENSCQLQQSVDGGVNWTLAFDYSLCLPQPSIVEVNNVIQLGGQGIQDLREQYDGTPASIAPDVMTSENQDDLVCYAVDVFVSSILELAADEREDDARLQALVAGALGVLAVVVAIPTLGLSTYILPLAMATAFTTLGAGLTAIEVDELRDREAQEKLICCMRSALEGSGLTQAEFEASLDGCNFPENSDEQHISDALKPMLTDEDLYLSFLNLMEETDPFYQAGLYTCPCSDDNCQRFVDAPPNSEYEIIHGVWDDTAITSDNTPVINNADNVNSASYPLNASGSSSGIAVAVRLTFAIPITVDVLRFSYRMTASGNTNLIRGFEIIEHTTDTLLQREEQTRPNNTSDTFYPEWTGLGLTNVGSIVVWVSKTSNPTTAGDADILDVCVE